MYVRSIYGKKIIVGHFGKQMFTYQLHGIFSFCNFFVFKMTHCDKNEEKQT